MSADSQMQFDILDKSISEIRIVLLVQIGKEGWDCRSLTGIILSQEGDCPTNMVLQTSCRCLRQVIKNGQETALIYLNESNAEKLNMQLERQHHISLKEFSSADNSKTTLKRYNRTAYLKLPKVEFYQLKISYDTLTVEKANPEVSIEKSVDSAQIAGNIICIYLRSKIRNVQQISFFWYQFFCCIEIRFVTKSFANIGFYQLFIVLRTEIS